MLSMNLNGNVGIGTTTPYSRLEVWGPDTSAGTAALTISNNASTTELQVFDNGSATLAGTLTQSSDQRLKTNIQSLDASSSLSLIDALNPVTFNWADPTQASTTQLGFIAQDVQKIFPELVSMTAATALTPDGTLGLNYIGLIPPLVKAVQALAAKVDDLSNTVAGFALNLVSAHVTATVGDFDTVNAKKVNADELCVKNSDGTPICVTGDQLSALLAGGNTSVSASSIPSASVDSTTTPPVIQINGNNPAYINVGDSYADPGVTITGPQADLNLGIKTFLNGALVSNIVLDTSAVATDTIDYVAIDQADDTSTSTRTVIISPAVQADTASTTPQ